MNTEKIISFEERKSRLEEEKSPAPEDTDAMLAYMEQLHERMVEIHRIVAPGEELGWEW